MRKSFPTSVLPKSFISLYDGREEGCTLKFASFTYDGVEKYGIVNEDGSQILDVTMIEDAQLPKTFSEFIVDYESFLKVKKLEGQFFRGEVDDKLVYSTFDEKFRWLPPITNLKKNIIAVGKNYLAHAKEMGSSKPGAPIFFTKAPTTVIGHGEKIVYDPTVTNEVDYEGELAIIIGKNGRRIKREEAYDYIFGFTILNDVTARDLQRRHEQYFVGKSLDTFCPIGPYVVPKDQFIPFEKKELITRVNGEIRQRATFEQMIFDIPVLLEELSKGMTLEPGDIIATGTPSGVAMGMNPPCFLQNGDVVEIEIEGIGLLKNEVVCAE